MVLSMDRWQGKVAVVTGASSGIGASIAEHLVKAGVNVVGLARRLERLEELSKKLEGAKGKLHAVKADITKEDEVVEAFKQADKIGSVSILVNNAGIGRMNTLIDGDTKKWQEVFDTNVLGLCVATREAVKIMRKNNVDGHVVHINSVAGHSVPNHKGMNVYPASKFAVTALTETLRQELNAAGTKIKITSVSPGFVKTKMIEAAVGKEMAPKLMEMVKDWAALQAEDIAQAVVYTLSTPPHVQVHEITIKPL